MQTYRNQKPLLGNKINWSHSLAQELVGCWVFNEGAGNKVFDSSENGLDGNLLNMDPTTDWILGSNGYGLDFDGNNDIIDCGTGSRIVTDFSGGKGSVVMVAEFDVGSDPFETLICKRDGGTVEWQLFIHDTGVLGFRIGATTVNTIGATVVEDSVRRVYGFTYNNPTVEIFLDGISDGISGSVFSAPTRQDVNLAIGGRWATYPTPDKLLNGRIYSVFVWNRSLSDAEQLEMAINPYGMFELLNIPLEFMTTAVVGGANVLRRPLDNYTRNLITR